jgi:hypothetical protein
MTSDLDKRQTDRVIPTYPLKFVLGGIIGIKRKKIYTCNRFFIFREGEEGGVIFTDEHNYAQLTETEDVICDMTSDHSYTFSPPSEVPQTPINSTVNYTSPGMYMYT